MPSDDAMPDPDDIETMFARQQRRLYQYILGMVRNPTDAEDVLQNTNLVVWEKFDQFTPGTDFRAWVLQICTYEIYKFRDRQRATGHNVGDDRLLEQLTAVYQRREGLLDLRRAVLPGCVEQLPESDRELVEAVYGQGIEVPLLAHQLGRKPTSLYRTLRRIRRVLHRCIERSVREDPPK